MRRILAAIVVVSILSVVLVLLFGGQSIQSDPRCRGVPPLGTAEFCNP
jgi:hypothetical protein